MDERICDQFEQWGNLMRETFLPFSPPLIGEEEIAEVIDTLRSDWISTGPKEQGSGEAGKAEEQGS